MVILTPTNQRTKSTARLTLQTVEIAAETKAIGCLDWDRDRFDINALEPSKQDHREYSQSAVRNKLPNQ